MGELNTSLNIVIKKSQEYLIHVLLLLQKYYTHNNTNESVQYHILFHKNLHNCLINIILKTRFKFII